MIKGVLNTTFLGNAAVNYIVSLAVLLLAVIFINLLIKLFLRRLKGWFLKTTTSVDDFFIEIQEKLIVPLPMNQKAPGMSGDKWVFGSGFCPMRSVEGVLKHKWCHAHAQGAWLYLGGLCFILNILRRFQSYLRDSLLCYRQ